MPMVYLGADHGGFTTKEAVKDYLKEAGIAFKDLGAFSEDPHDDYPQFAFTVAENVAREDKSDLPWLKRSKGLLFCRSAGGMVLAANKVKNARAVAVYDRKSVLHARQHNDANIIAISGDWIASDSAKILVNTFLFTEFSREARHVRRLKQIREYESG